MRKEAEMTATLYGLLRAYEKAEELIMSVEAQIEEVSEGLGRLRGIVRMRASGLRIALGKEPLPEEEGGHEQAVREISPAEPPAPPAGTEDETSAKPDEGTDEGMDIVIGEGDTELPDISFGDEIRIVEEPTGREPIL
jgi:hypothetical protein